MGRLFPIEKPTGYNVNVAALLGRSLMPGLKMAVRALVETAKNVGARHGRPVVLLMEAEQMHDHGYHFLLSGNGVWLTESVPPEYIVFSELIWQESGRSTRQCATNR